jgi:hypothetical protein
MDEFVQGLEITRCGLNTQLAEVEARCEHGSRGRTGTGVEFLQEFAAAIYHSANRVNVEVPEYLISKEASLSFADGIRERDIRLQLLLGGKETLGEAVNQVLELEAVDIAVVAPSRVRQTMARTFWRSHPPPPKRKDETTDSIRTGAVGASATFERSVPMNRMKKTTGVGGERANAR